MWFDLLLSRRKLHLTIPERLLRIYIDAQATWGAKQSYMKHFMLNRVCTAHRSHKNESSCDDKEVGICQTEPIDPFNTFDTFSLTKATKAEMS